MTEKTGGKKGVNTRSPAIKAFRELALAVMEKQHVRWLIKHHDLFVDFWQSWCDAYNYKYSNFVKEERIRKKAADSLRRMKYAHAGIRVIKTYADNYVIFHEQHIDKDKESTKQTISEECNVEQIKIDIEQSKIDIQQETTDVERGGTTTNKKICIDKPQRRASKGSLLMVDQSVLAGESQNDAEEVTINRTHEVVRHSHRIQKKKISEISFSSPITVSTVDRITQASQFTKFFSSDYLYFMTGGTDEDEIMPDGQLRKRFNQQLTHLETANKLRVMLKNTISNMMQAIKSDELTAHEEAQIKRKIALIEAAMKAAREIDLQPILFLNSIEEGAFSQQKALQGAISNDRMMVDNGNVIFEPEEAKVVNTNALDNDLKLIAEAFTTKHIEAIA